jgi:hypothetical protein
MPQPAHIARWQQPLPVRLRYRCWRGCLVFPLFSIGIQGRESPPTGRLSQAQGPPGRQPREQAQAGTRPRGAASSVLLCTPHPCPGGDLQPWCGPGPSALGSTPPPSRSSPAAPAAGYRYCGRRAEQEGAPHRPQERQCVPEAAREGELPPPRRGAVRGRQHALSPGGDGGGSTGATARSSTAS